MASRIHATTCPLDCPDACSLEVQVVDDRLHSIDGSNSNEFTDGYICGKVRNFADHFYCDDRLKRPAKRVGEKGDGHFQDISWDEAFDLMTSRIKADCEQFGSESILPLCYGGSNGKLTQDTVDMRFFYRLGASHLDRTVCAAPSTAAYNGLYGKMPGVALTDYVHSKLIVVWGNNPHASGIHLVKHVQKAQENGAKLVVIDPRTTPLAGKADLHIPLYPGTDLPVALAIINWIVQNEHTDESFISETTNGFEELAQRASAWSLAKAADVARVPVESLETLCRWYVETYPAVIRCGWGPERNRNGGSAIAAILAIPALANKFCRGGGFTMSNSGAWRLPTANVIQQTPPDTRHINMNLVGEHLLTLNDPPIRTLFVYNCNPVATLPEQNKLIRGLQREDLFTVVFDQVMTDTAKYADVILPATTFLEHDDLRSGYGNTRLGKVTPAVPREGEARPNLEVFAELIQKLHLEQPGDITSATELQAALLGERSEVLEQTGELAPEMGLAPIQMQDTQPFTSSGKIELFPAILNDTSEHGLYVYQADPQTNSYPLALLSPATSQTVNSTFGQLRKHSASVRMHPADADQRSLTDGCEVRVFNSSGEVFVNLEVSEKVRIGVVEIPKGIWRKSTKNGKTSNALSPDTLSDIGAGACFNDARVQVE